MNDKLDEKNKIIGIDGRCLLDANYTGVSEYTVVLLEKIIKDYPRKKIIIFLNGFKNRGIQKKLLWLRQYKNVQIRHYHFPSKFLNFVIWFFDYPKIDKMLGGVDVFIAPNISFLAISKSTKFILTVHDLSFERFKETFSWKRRFWHFVINPRRLCREADEIWTVSHSTKWDLKYFYNISSKKIKVKSIVRNLKLFSDFSKEDGKLNKVQKKYNLPQKFILYLGTIEPRKNIINLVKSYEYLRENKKIKNKCKLVIAGQFGWNYKKIIEYIKQSQFSKDIIVTNFIDQVDKDSFYQLAMVFVYPSLFEGFGIPLLEAMANGVPVITSNNSSIPEVIGRAGIMIDPDRAEDLIDALDLMVNDKKLREYYIKEGLQQSKKIIKNSKKIRLLE